MLYFFHHYELPAILQQERIQQIVTNQQNNQETQTGIRNNAQPDANHNTEQATGNTETNPATGNTEQTTVNATQDPAMDNTTQDPAMGNTAQEPPTVNAAQDSATGNTELATGNTGQGSAMVNPPQGSGTDNVVQGEEASNLVPSTAGNQYTASADNKQDDTNSITQLTNRQLVNTCHLEANKADNTAHSPNTQQTDSTTPNSVGKPDKTGSQSGSDLDNPANLVTQKGMNSLSDSKICAPEQRDSKHLSLGKDSDKEISGAHRKHVSSDVNPSDNAHPAGALNTVINSLSNSGGLLDDESLDNVQDTRVKSDSVEDR